jgi:hypothetical protein
MQEALNLHYWQGRLNQLKSHDSRVTEEYRGEYRYLVKKAISQGLPVPASVIRQYPESTRERERHNKRAQEKDTYFPSSPTPDLR